MGYFCSFVYSRICYLRYKIHIFCRLFHLKRNEKKKRRHEYNNFAEKRKIGERETDAHVNRKRRGGGEKRRYPGTECSLARSIVKISKNQRSLSSMPCIEQRVCCQNSSFPRDNVKSLSGNRRPGFETRNYCTVPCATFTMRA